MKAPNNRHDSNYIGVYYQLWRHSSRWERKPFPHEANVFALGDSVMTNAA